MKYDKNWDMVRAVVATNAQTAEVEEMSINVTAVRNRRSEMKKIHLQLEKEKNGLIEMETQLVTAGESLQDSLALAEQRRRQEVFAAYTTKISEIKVLEITVTMCRDFGEILLAVSHVCGVHGVRTKLKYIGNSTTLRTFHE